MIDVPPPEERDAIKAELGQVADELATVNATSTELYARRLALLLAGRALQPPITQRELAAAAGVSEEAVIQVLRKAQRQAAEANAG